jgi:2-polyprenyl-3-methyl-5-hydroxy-6-metoxy-1,4-benzoquinol methylase
MMLQWYEFLSSARGITSANDVRRLTEEFAAGYQRLLGNLLPQDKNAPIYDTGCGPGVALSILRTLGYSNLEGTDLSASAIAIARDLGLCVAQTNSIEDLAARTDGSFSRIFAIDLIEHLDRPDLMRFLQVARAKLRSEDGMLILRCPNGDSPIVGRNLFNDVTHVWAYTSTALTGLLMMSGFKSAVFLDETIPFGPSGRWFRTLTLKASSALIRLLIKAATRENIDIIAASFWVVAKVD